MTTPWARIPILALFGVWVLGGTSGCLEAGPTDAEDAGAPISFVRVEAEVLRPTTFDDRVEATGNLEADEDATLSARAGGTLEFLEELGAAVDKGQTVARIDRAMAATGVKQAEASLNAARASLKLAEQRYNRQRPLFEKGVISALEFQSIRAELEGARAQLAQAEASLAQARESVENTRVLAPFDGVVDAHFVESGEQVNPGTPVLRVLDASILTVRAGIPERYAADIRKGAEVEVRLPAYGLEPRKGRVRFVATAIDPKSRTFDIEVALENKDGRLKPEMVARVVVTRARLEDVLVVPQHAVLRDEEGEHVFTVVEADGGRLVARRRGIRPVGRGSGKVVVKGVSAGDLVVVVGQTKLIDGDFVEVQKKEALEMPSAQAGEK